jgi:hypothetical protein
MMRRHVFVLAMCVVFAGCAEQSASSRPETGQAATTGPLPQEVQAELDRLNAQCESEPWRSEIDVIERPDTRPKNRIVRGEVIAFVSDCTQRLAEHGVQVKWNPERKLYEVKRAQQTDALDKR